MASELLKRLDSEHGKTSSYEELVTPGDITNLATTRKAKPENALAKIKEVLVGKEQKKDVVQPTALKLEEISTGKQLDEVNKGNEEPSIDDGDER